MLLSSVSMTSFLLIWWFFSCVSFIAVGVMIRQSVRFVNSLPSGGWANKKVKVVEAGFPGHPEVLRIEGCGLLLTPVIPTDRRESRNLLSESHLPLQLEIPRFATLTVNQKALTTRHFEGVSPAGA
jgi:hypothetical protein